MNTTTRWLGLLGSLVLSASGARALDSGPYAMELLVGGAPVQEYPARGTTYVEALRGRDYAIRLVNRTGERVAVALSVDGLNSIDARRTSALAARKWILGPWESVTIEGWQTSGTTARRFVFTTEKDSYGAWLRRTDDLGVVGAAFFRERRPPPREVQEMTRQRGAAPTAPKALSDESAATGIGDQIDHRVRAVEFEPEAAPAASLRVRYEYRDALVRLGVVPRPRCDRDDALARRERARGFDDEGFAPDPYRRRR